MLSGAPAYNLFHIAGGLAGVALVLQAGGRGAVGFNLAFGLIDLYQAVADLLHVTLGLGLVGLGALGWRRGMAGAPAGGDPARGGPGIGAI